MISECEGRRFMGRKGTLLLKLPSSSSSKALIRCVSFSSSSSSSSRLCRAEYPVPEDDDNGLRRVLCCCCWGSVEGASAGSSSCDPVKSDARLASCASDTGIYYVPGVSNKKVGKT